MLSDVTAAQVLQNARNVLQNLRGALTAANNLATWGAGVSAAQLEAAPVSMSPADAQAVLSAIADAGALAQLYGMTAGAPAGTLPAGYSLPYPFGASQRILLGPG